MSHALLKSRLPTGTRSSLARYPPCMFGSPNSDSGFDPTSDRELKRGAEREEPQQQPQVTVTNATSTTDDYPHVDVNEAWGPPLSVCPTSAQQTPTKKRGSRRNTCKNVYKHVPHKDKPPHLVARRNARERRRVQAVNSAFARLRRCVPVENRSKRLSKVKTLHKAIEYIDHLQSLLDEADAQIQTTTAEYAHQDLLGKKENVDGHMPWTSNIEMSCRHDDFETFASFYEGYIDYQN